MIGLWRAHRARKVAVRLIGPLVSGTRFRLGAIPDRVWSDPYIVGFLSMLITRFAQQRVSGLGPEALGLVQCEAFAVLSGVSTDAIGQRILALSSCRDRVFEHGCDNALIFAAAFDDIEPAGALSTDVDQAPNLRFGSLDLVELWISTFDRYLFDS